MSVATDFRAWLIAQPTITGLIGKRVGITFVDENDVLPYVTFRRSGSSQDYCLDGTAEPDVTTFDLEVRADTPAEAELIADEIRRLVNGFPQNDLTGDARKWNGRDVCCATVMDQDDDYEILPVGSFETDSIIALIIEVISNAPA